MTNESLTFARVRHVNVSRCERWHQGDSGWTAADWATAFGGEVGEALNIVKKLRRAECSMPGAFDPDNEQLLAALADEVADVFLYLDLLAAHYGIDVGEAVAAKFNRTSDRYGFPEKLP